VKKFNLLCVAGVVGAVLVPASASAAPVSANANGKAILLIPLKLTKVQDLDFGTVVTSAALGQVTVDPSSGAATPSGGVTLVGTTSTAAQFEFAGTANQTVNFSISTALPITLSDGAAGDTMSLSALNLSATSGTVDPTSLTVKVGVGGTIDVGANQADGVYTGQFDVTADYN
jgi:hypothetical protein